MTTEKLSARIRFEVGWGYSDGPTNRLVDDARTLEQALEKARAELQAVKGEHERMRTEWYNENTLLSASLVRVTAERDAARLAALREARDVVADKTEAYRTNNKAWQFVQDIIDAETEVGKVKHAAEIIRLEEANLKYRAVARIEVAHDGMETWYHVYDDHGTMRDAQDTLEEAIEACHYLDNVEPADRQF